MGNDEQVYHYSKGRDTWDGICDELGFTSLFLTCLSIYEDGDGRERCWLVVNGYISSAKTRTVFCRTGTAQLVL